MYALKNKVQLIGNLGNAPEVKTLESGKKMARFSVATSENYRNAKGEKEHDPLRLIEREQQGWYDQGKPGRQSPAGAQNCPRATRQSAGD